VAGIFPQGIGLLWRRWFLRYRDAGVWRSGGRCAGLGAWKVGLGARNRFAVAVLAALAINVLAHVGSVSNQIAYMSRAPDFRDAAFSFPRTLRGSRVGRPTWKSETIEVVGDSLARFLFLRAHSVHRTNNFGLAQFETGGHWLKSVGTWGTGPNQFNIVHSVAVYNQDNVYAADRNNHRIQVYDDNLNFKKSITGMGAPWGSVHPKSRRQRQAKYL
jgi:hypothetical protein